MTYLRGAMPSAMLAAIDYAIVFYAVADDFTAAVGTSRGERMDRAFEGIKLEALIVANDREHFLVVVSTDKALSH